MSPAYFHGMPEPTTHPDTCPPLWRMLLGPRRDSWTIVLLSILVVTVVFSSILGDSVLLIRDILVTTSFGPEGRLVEPVINKDGEHTRNLVITSAPDARWWIMHAERMARTGEFRIRHTGSDNPPVGREVHWSSLQMWNLVGLGKLLSWTKDRTDLSDIEWAALFVGPVTLFLAMAAGMMISLRAFGRSVALAFPVAVLVGRPLLYFFRGGEADHHGLVAMFAMLGVLLLIAGRLGFTESGESRASKGWFIWAGVMSAAGLWISAATQLPVIVATGAGVILATLVFSRKSRAALDPSVWRLWGLAGGLASIGFYLLEYFPSHMGLRLEVNNPVYALAWMAGGEMLRRAVLFLQTGKPPLRSVPDWLAVAACLILIALPAVMIVLGGERYFVISNKFLYSLHEFFINEFMSIVEVAKSTGIHYAVFAYSCTLAALVIALLAGLGKRIGRPDLATIVFAACPAGIMTALAFHQIRWSGTAAALYIPLFIASFLSLSRLFQAGIRWRWVVAWVVLALAAIPTPVTAGLRYLDYVENGDMVDKASIPSVLTRDICQRLAAAEPSRRPVVLASPSCSTEIAYYGGAKAIGTLYWENLAGLRAGADIYSTTDEREAFRLIQKLGITHILLFSWDSFGQRYVRLGRGLGKETEARDGFIPALLEGTRNQPTWLNPLFYPLPKEYKLGDDQWVRIYEVAPGQSKARWFHHVGIYQIDSGKPDLAMRSFEESIRLDAKDPAPHLALVMLLAAKGAREELTANIAKMRSAVGPQADEIVRKAADQLDGSGQKPEANLLRNSLSGPLLPDDRTSPP
jgi:hypothetical protein